MDSLRALIREAAQIQNKNQPGRREHRRLRVTSGRDRVLVRFSNGRGQIIRILQKDEHYSLTSPVIGRKRVQRAGEDKLLPYIWKQNRNTNVVGFTLDRKGNLIGRIDHLAASLDAHELAFYIEVLARECDRLEYILTGRDER